jgi:hypothetical protein
MQRFGGEVLKQEKIRRENPMMTNAQETRNMEFRSSRALKDAIALASVTIIAVVLSYFFDMFVLIVKFLQKHPDRIVYVDEVIAGLLTLSIGLAVFAWRRWLELRQETAERIKKQDELLSLTATQAEVERLISKQLRHDMDQMKEDVREILRLVVCNLKK